MSGVHPHTQSAALCIFSVVVKPLFNHLTFKLTKLSSLNLCPEVPLRNSTIILVALLCKVPISPSDFRVQVSVIISLFFILSHVVSVMVMTSPVT